ncbi:MAG: hypothetical protein J1F32_05475 [Erysipelotrichales bacterium]|nr:hypothetical protein [Erysipelotrichales bacterium]
MKKVIDKKEILDLLSKKYILVAVAVSNMKAYYVTLIKNKYVFNNPSVSYKFTKGNFIEVISEYNFYLVDSKEEISINQEFDINTLKQ